MYIVTRYVVWEVTKSFVIALVGLTLVFTLVFGLKAGSDRGLPMLVMVRILPYLTPYILEITIPVAMLFAVTTVFGRMTGMNEVVALNSLGVGPMTIVWPALVLAAFVSLGTVSIYELDATWGKRGFASVVYDSFEEIAYGALQKDKSLGKDDDPYSIVVKEVRPPAEAGGKPRLIEPTFTIKGPPKLTFRAAEAKLDTDRKAGQIWIELQDYSFDYGDGGARMSFAGIQRYQVPIPPPAVPPYNRFYVAMADIPDRIAEIEVALRRIESIRHAQNLLGPKDPEDDAKVLDYHLRIRQLRAEPYRRWANGFTCLCFAMIGAPVAMLWRHADMLTNFFVCFLPILAIYYPLLMLSDGLATSGQMPPISFWTANVVLGGVAIWLLRWVNRH
jgi:lipopolysaccharide export system permease protein